ncbi:RNA exonuclease 3 [Entophlyctis luteolus]|nr:RNA exonuclease 3 [Entophlyctis luteolus]
MFALSQDLRDALLGRVCPAAVAAHAAANAAASAAGASDAAAHAAAASACAYTAACWFECHCAPHSLPAPAPQTPAPTQQEPRKRRDRAVDVRDMPSRALPQPPMPQPKRLKTAIAPALLPAAKLATVATASYAKATAPRTTQSTSRPGKSAALVLTASNKPMVPIALNSKVDRAKRQRVLDFIFDEFVRIYSPIASLISPTLPHEHALKQEMALNMKSTTPQMYSTIAMPVINRLKKRPPATSATDVGIDGEWKPPAAVVPPLNFESLLATDADLARNGFPLGPARHTFGDDHVMNLAASGVGKLRCDRCGKEFVWPDILGDSDFEVSVRSTLVLTKEKACKYHRLRAQYVAHPTTAERHRVFPCCSADATGASFTGCCAGPHVYKDTDFASMDIRVGYTVLPPSTSLGPGTLHVPVVAIDCEMSYTRGGMEVTRVSVVDEQGNIIIDELLRPVYDVVDLNTEWSGVSSLEAAVHTLSSIHRLLFSLGVTSETVIIGHGLENDLNALRIVHRRVVDTSLLVVPQRGTNADGTVAKFPLRRLCERLVGTAIQTGSRGHDSVEDARAALEVAKAVLRKKLAGADVKI